MSPIRHFRANVVAYLALFVALCTGSAYAANQVTGRDIAKNAVRAKHIKDGQVRGAELGAGAVSGPKVADDSLTGADIDESSLRLNLPAPAATPTPAPEKPDLSGLAQVVVDSYLPGAGPLSPADRCNGVMGDYPAVALSDKVLLSPGSLPDEVVFTAMVGDGTVTYKACYFGSGSVNLGGDVRFMVLRATE